LHVTGFERWNIDSFGLFGMKLLHIELLIGLHKGYKCGWELDISVGVKAVGCEIAINPWEGKFRIYSCS